MNYQEIKAKACLILDLTSLTLEEFEELLPHFEQAFLDHMSHWRMDGRPRTSRGFSPYKNCPLPTPKARLLFILSYLKTNPIQSYHGAAFGMCQ